MAETTSLFMEHIPYDEVDDLNPGRCPVLCNGSDSGENPEFFNNDALASLTSSNIRSDVATQTTNWCLCGNHQQKHGIRH
jgi:hypothetical protein